MRIIVIVVLIAVAIVPGVLAWRSVGESTMSWQGWAALVLGAVVTAALGGGLMALVFYSNRRGFDERADEAAAEVMPKPDDRAIR